MQIDLNADLGEGFGIWRLTDDEALLDVVTSANVACGFHAGDPATMRRVCDLAAERGVAIGAQVGYRDLTGFGRRRIDVAPGELAAEVMYQLGALDAFARAAGSRVRYVKPHGALYNTAADDPVQAAAVASAVAAVDASLPLLGLPGSALATAAAQADLPFVAEGFADRAYTPAGRLVPRTEPGAVHADPAAAVAQAVSIARRQQVTALDGTPVDVPAASICVHGDTLGAVLLAREIRRVIEDAGIAVAPFAAP
ncbi:MAG TPA: 5-oxoprolinase subunit PxpA [Jatrophihabitantaceae bacterium]|nr:5-oxoprolinase subunit PxpA [Jatrophihabitantaceae bacterium]